MNDNSTLKLNKDNCVFILRGGLTYCSVSGKEERAFLHLAFPYYRQDEYISVLDADGTERGMNMKLSDLDEKSAEVCKTELARRYYTPKIRKILKMQEKNGYAYWTVSTDNGEIQFTVRDNFRNFFKIGDDSAVIYDMEGNRFTIESVSALDRKSRRTIELYL